MARPRKPLEQHKADGTYRADRHGGVVSADEVAGSGSPQMPTTFKGHAKSCWNSVVKLLVDAKIARAIDTPHLVAMCEWWARYRTVSDAIDKVDPGVDPMLYCRLEGVAVKAWSMFSRIAGRFGMTPADRASLRVDIGEKKKGVAARQRG